MDTTPVIDARWLAGEVDDRSARGIAAGVAGLIRRGSLAAGTQLPTVRALAHELSVSPATVSEAWSLLRSRRALVGRGRTGTRVVGVPSTPHPSRFERIGNFGERLAVDLTLAGPDAALLPPLEPALLQATGVGDLNGYRRDAITPELSAAVSTQWPFRADELMAVDGGFQGLMVVLQTTLVPGDHVAVEDPTTPRLLDILDLLGANVVPVACDESGPLPDALTAALLRRPAAFVFQPRAQSPVGSVVDEQRAGELAAVLGGTETLVVENDGTGDASVSSVASVGRLLPEQTVMVRSFSKSHGPDLRIAVVGGPSAVVERARVRRSYGSGWTSRLLQMALAWMLTDDGSMRAVTAARSAYAARRQNLADALHERGVEVANRDGLSVWIPVADERAALVTLAARGIAVTPGDRFWIGRGRPHVRAATSRVVDGVEELADALALAAENRF